MDEARLQGDQAARLSALTALYAAAMQRDSAVQAGVVAVYTIVFAFTGVMITAIANHPLTFQGFRVALVPLPIWVLVTLAVVMSKAATLNQRRLEHLQSRLDAIAGVDRHAFDTIGGRGAWGLVGAGMLVVLAPCALLPGLTIYCLVRAAAAGWGWLPCAVLYTIFAVILWSAALAGRSRPPDPQPATKTRPRPGAKHH